MVESGHSIIPMGHRARHKGTSFPEPGACLWGPMRNRAANLTAALSALYALRGEPRVAACRWLAWRLAGLAAWLDPEWSSDSRPVPLDVRIRVAEHILAELYRERDRGP